MYSVGQVDTPRKNQLEFIFDDGLGRKKRLNNQPAESTTHELRLVSTTDSALQWLAVYFFWRLAVIPEV